MMITERRGKPVRIQELERIVGIERATIRFYEKEGLIAPVRSENGYRDYSEADAEELQRIRLLRELGVSLDTIRNLQNGSEDFAAVMRRQCQILAGRRDQMEQARIVCERISADGVGYTQLDTLTYQLLLDGPLLTTGQGSGDSFCEREYRQPHPWRRYFARVMDHALLAAVLWFFIVVVLRIRPAGQIGQQFLGYMCWFGMMPLEAACLHRWGTTPGKRIMGIRVEAAEGGRLSYSDAIVRAWKVFRHGMFLGIPLVNLYCMYRGYQDHNKNWNTMWDEDCEVGFRRFSWKNIAVYILIFAVAMGLNVVSAVDSTRPGYRSDDLTEAQFIANYNFYNDLLMNNTAEPMNRYGQVEKPSYIQGSGAYDYDPYDLFEYSLYGSRNIINHIRFRHSWYQPNQSLDHTEEKEILSYWIPQHVRLAAYTAVMSQSGEPYDTLFSYRDQLLADMKQYTPDGFSGKYGEITIYWHLRTEKAVDYAEEYADLYKVTLYFEIVF